VDELVVIAAHGPEYSFLCRRSLAPSVAVTIIDTGSGTVVDADVVLDDGCHPTGAYLWAYEHLVADAYLFIQDSMTAVTPNPLPWFREQMPDLGTVAWGRFPMQWDNPEQRARVEAAYPGVHPPHGILGPIFYVNRKSLDVLAEKGLLPAVPTNRMEAQGTERAWAYAFAAAGLPVAGPEWNPGEMAVGFGPFKKVWAGRP
jgi:hypothetical protein